MSLPILILAKTLEDYPISSIYMQVPIWLALLIVRSFVGAWPRDG